MWGRTLLLILFSVSSSSLLAQDSSSVQYVVHHRHWVYHFVLAEAQNESEAKPYIDRLWTFFQSKPEFEQESVSVTIRSHRFASMPDLLSEIPELLGQINSWTIEEEDE